MHTLLLVAAALCFFVAVIVTTPVVGADVKGKSFNWVALGLLFWVLTSFI